MTDLRDNQWELGDVQFGMYCDIEHESDVTPGSYSVKDQDAGANTRDGSSMGRDLFEPGIWAFKLFTNLEDEVEALAALSKIAKAWRADDVRDKVGEVMELRYRLAGRTRRVYGRPRRFDAPFDNRMYGGLIPITADFKMVSELFFDDVEQSYPVGQLAPTTGGFEAPFETPVATEETEATQPYSFTIGGDVATPGLYDFSGPVSDPVLDIDNGALVVRLEGTIPGGRTVTVDTRPWMMTAYLDNGTPVPALISRRTRLPKLMLKPGGHIASYSGVDETGTSRAKVRWRNAHPSV